jgi:hypothetical protein
VKIQFSSFVSSFASSFPSLNSFISSLTLSPEITSFSWRSFTIFSITSELGYLDLGVVVGLVEVLEIDLVRQGDVAEVVLLCNTLIDEEIVEASRFDETG